MVLSGGPQERVFIINPASAGGTTLRVWAEAKRRLSDLGVWGSEHITACPGDASDAARRALSEGKTQLVAVGGDGTLNEVLNGYLNGQGASGQSQAVVGFLPSGTGADFRRSLGIMGLDDAIQRLTRSETCLSDSARVTLTGRDGIRYSRYLINAATIGLGGAAAAVVDKWRGRVPRWISGKTRYMGAVLWALGRHRNIHADASLDGQPPLRIHTNLIVAANGRYAGSGMMIAPHASTSDGLLDIIITDKMSTFEILRELPRLSSGGHLRNPKVLEKRAREVTIHSQESLAVEIDGEVAGFTPVHVEVLPLSVRFSV